MCRIYCSANIEVDICCLLKQKSADKRSSVLLKIPLLIKLILSKIIFGKLNYLIHCNNAFGYQIYSFYIGDGRNVTAFKF